MSFNKTQTPTAAATAATTSIKKHSISSSNVTNCNTDNTTNSVATEAPSSTIAATTTRTAAITTTNAAVDTPLKEQKEQIQQQHQKQEKLSSKTSTSSPLQQQQQRNQRKKRHYHQPHEVKARLDTLRTRKPPVVALADNQTKAKGHKNDENVSQKTLAAEEIGKKQDDDNNDHKFNQHKDEGFFRRRVFPPLDEATLNLIEVLSDNEVKKPTTKRKRNQAALLGFNIQPARSRRATATAQAAVIVAAAGATADRSLHNLGIVGGGQKQLTGSDFLKPLPIEAGSTNSKKRPRIMSLYERPYQTASDGRGGGGGSVVSNGYMSTSRSSSSGGGGGSGTAMVMSDSNDSQDMTNQYYLSGTSGSGIAGNSNSSALLGNGSAINHAPTMGTLCNIGNTCYLNSVVYTLRFAPQFLHNLHHLLTDLNALQQNIARARAKSSSLGRGMSAVHMENARSWSSKDLASMEQYASNAVVGGLSNTVASATTSSSSTATALTQVTQKSSHQLLTEKLHELYQSLYRNEMNESTEPHHADTLLHAIQDVSSIFEGNQQQDAHEFLMCLLNSIRETSQTLIKAIAECPDVIMNGYISNPDDVERDMKHSNVVGGGGVGGNAGGNNSGSNSNNMTVSSALSSLTSNSKSSLFFSRKSKRKDETKNSKNSRLQSPLKDNQITGNTTPQSNSHFYLNSNDLNSSASTSPPSAAGGSSSITSPSNSTSAAQLGANDEIDASSTPLAVLLKDKQRLEGRIRELGLDFFNDDFEGITVSTTKCLSCETITEQKETMIDIAVPVPQAGYESNEYNMDRPSSFIQNSCITREYFRNENKYRCEQCCGYTEAIRSISYEVLPRLLIIQLSRFSGGMEKINSYIPTSFTLQCFCSKCCELSDANKLHIYKLYSVITHVGATMSVGHYIAYTCSLDWANEYINCPKEQRRRASQERAAAAAGTNGGGSGGGNGSTLTGSQTQAANSQTSSSSTNASSLGSSSSTTSFMKIMKFGRNKASSSGDMSKNVKHLNGLTTSSKAITNGIGKLTMNNASSGGSSSTSATAASQCSTTCPSISCCAMRLTAQQQLHYLHNSQTNASDFSEDSTGYSNGSSAGGSYANANYNNNMHQPYVAASSSNTSGYGSTGRGATKASYASQIHNGSEPIWYMCDDDKIKAMTQREFEELLSPARKITITPYLLFYARYNLQTSSPPKSATSSSSPGPVTSSPQASWSNESLQSSGHSGGAGHSSGMRM
uniref:USP domain-containing protein n=1 Tax=Stomoxys calcitrans TaxID=35570 RepID=A0A1I8P5T6_STOCA